MALKDLPVIDDPKHRGPLIDDLAQIVIDYYCLLIDSQRLPSAREAARALEDIAEFARTAQPASMLPRTGLPWGNLPIGPVPDYTAMRSALTLVAEEARAVERDPTPENIDALAKAARDRAKPLHRAAGKTGAHGTLGAARHPEAEFMVDRVAAAFREHGQKTTLRGKGWVKEDFKERPLFIAVRAIMASCEVLLLERGKEGCSNCRKALDRLDAARDAPYPLCEVVRAFNRRVANGQVVTVPPGSIVLDARKPREPK